MRMFPPIDDEEQDAFSSDLARLAALMTVYVQVTDLILRLEFYDSKFVNWSDEKLKKETFVAHDFSKKPPG